MKDINSNKNYMIEVIKVMKIKVNKKRLYVHCSMYTMQSIQNY